MFGKINACATVFLKAELWRDESAQKGGSYGCLRTVLLIYFFFWHFTPPGDLKSEDPASKEAGDEKAEEDNDYHRSDEQVGFPVPSWPH